MGALDSASIKITLWARGDSMWLWVILLGLNIYGFITNIQSGSAIWAAISAIGIVFCLRALIPLKTE
jgi:hypothetical protein